MKKENKVSVFFSEDIDRTKLNISYDKILNNIIDEYEIDVKNIINISLQEHYGYERFIIFVK